MAPEMFQGSSYGKEVDIWAFGSMAYEMATGLPPNAMSGVNGLDLGKVLKSHIPRLEGGSYSEGLRNIVAFCLEESPTDRPTIESVQRHSYIYNTSTKYPASGLSDLVRAFKMWENHGGIRKSLFMAGGAQGPSELSSTEIGDDSWNFSTTAAFDQAVAQDTNEQDVINVYGSSVNLSTDFDEETSRPGRQQIQPQQQQQLSRPSRRRPPPEALAPIRAPLEKIFDPNTMSNYEENSRAHYNQSQNYAASVSDLPLRHDTDQTSIRDTLIDLDALDVPSGLSSFTDMDTIRPGSRVLDDSDDFARPALSDPVDNLNRRTQDWKFPVMPPPASANPEVSRFPVPYVVQRPHVTPAVGARPALVHHPTEPISIPTQGSNSLAPSAPSSPNRMSLIDLDLSLPEPSRPSTADSTLSQEVSSANPFHLERHASLYHPTAREPSLYLPDDSGIGVQMRSGNTLRDFNEFSDFSASDTEGPSYEQYNGHSMHTSDSEPSFDDSAYNHSDYEQATGSTLRGQPGPLIGTESETRSGPRPASVPGRAFTMAHFPDLPQPPSVAALSGMASRSEMSSEMERLLSGLTAQLEAFRDVYDSK
jgi:Protein kinase domain